MPEPVMRTTPPSAMSPIARTAPAQASRRSVRVESGCVWCITDLQRGLAALRGPCGEGKNDPGSPLVKHRCPNNLMTDPPGHSEYVSGTAPSPCSSIPEPRYMTQQRDAWGERLPRHLGLWSAVAVLVGSTIGSGIFRVPATVAGQLGDPGPV